MNVGVGTDMATIYGEASSMECKPTICILWQGGSGLEALTGLGYNQDILILVLFKYHSQFKQLEKTHPRSLVEDASVFCR